MKFLFCFFLLQFFSTMIEHSMEISSRTAQSGETIEKKTFITRTYTGEKRCGKPNGQGVMIVKRVHIETTQEKNCT